MKRISNHLKAIFRDPLLPRVCIALVGSGLIYVSLPILGWGVPVHPLGWIFTILGLVLCAWGAFLVCAATLGSKTVLKRAASSINDSTLGASLLVFIILIVAYPITAILRKAKNVSKSGPRDAL